MYFSIMSTCHYHNQKKKTGGGEIPWSCPLTMFPVKKRSIHSSFWYAQLLTCRAMLQVDEFHEGPGSKVGPKDFQDFFPRLASTRLHQPREHFLELCRLLTKDVIFRAKGVKIFPTHFVTLKGPGKCLHYSYICLSWSEFPSVYSFF